MMQLIPIYSLLFLLLSCHGCDKDESTAILSMSKGSDPNFEIVKNSENVLPSFTRMVEVFQIKIFAVPAVTDANLLHTANVMAQYLDNNEDNVVDNSRILDKMIEKNAFMVLWKNEDDLDIDPPSGWEGQDLGNDETQPSFVRDGRKGTFDATLEEVLHIITHAGYAEVYPEVFGEKMGSEVAEAMDKARGGQFENVPDTYPTEAWYSYDDETCDYACMVTEYHYWALTSILGAQEFRSAEIGHEWRANTEQLVRTRDPAIYQLMTNSSYHFPTVLPDGSYRH